MVLPNHVVIIPDGNRRWARERGKPAPMGHKAGAEAVTGVLEAALDLGIPHMTLWGASVNNVTKRSKAEVEFLFQVLETYFEKLAKDKRTHENETRVRVLGRWRELFPASLKKAIQKAMDETAEYAKNNLTILLAYSGLDEMADAVRRVAEDARKDPALTVDEETIKKYLWTSDLPPADLVIRTGGEPHWSQGFMMWDVAEAQLYFTETLWPAFTPQEFKKAIENFGNTERRHGT